MGLSGRRFLRTGRPRDEGKGNVPSMSEVKKSGVVIQATPKSSQSSIAHKPPLKGSSRSYRLETHVPNALPHLLFGNTFIESVTPFRLPRAPLPSASAHPRDVRGAFKWQSPPLAGALEYRGTPPGGPRAVGSRSGPESCARRACNRHGSSRWDRGDRPRRSRAVLIGYRRLKIH
jgi:hypothetical protein